MLPALSAYQRCRKTRRRHSDQNHPYVAIRRYRWLELLRQGCVSNLGTI